MIVELTQNTAEWLDFRRNKIGASDLPIIMGFSPYSTPLSLWKRKLGFEPEPIMSAAMQYGRDTEDFVRKLVQDSLNKEFRPQVFQNDVYDWAIASVDGYNDNEDIVIEIKCANKNDHAEAINGQVPLKYYPQLQWQYFVTEAKKLFYCSYNDNLAIVEVKKDDEFIDKAVKQAKEFYERLVNFDPPKEEEKDIRIINDSSFKEIADEWKELIKMKKEIEKRENELKQKMLEYADGYNSEGYGVKMTKVIRKGTVDMSKIYQKFNISEKDVEGFRKKSTYYWKVSVS